jgi:hypothetical protein
VRSFIQRHGSKILGVLSGFDRLVFRGNVRQVAGADGMYHFLCSRGVRLKHFGKYAESVTERIKAAAKSTLERAGRRGIEYLESSRTNKEERALAIAREDRITEGLICVLSCVEPCHTFFIYRNRETKKIELRTQVRKGLHLYFYMFDRVFGFMNARIQTWLPLRVQICINGREWLARRLDRAGIGYERRDNTFARVSDVARAQAMLRRQLNTNWVKQLTRIARVLNPHHEEYDLFGTSLDYYWSAYQSEWATDLMFARPSDLAKIYRGLVLHGITTFSSANVMRFLGKPVRSNFRGEIVSDFKDRPEGVRVKHSIDMNSVKIYDKQASVLRVETTINQPRAFRAFRRAEGQSKGPKKWRYMRRGVADLRRRAEVSEASNRRYLAALAAVEDPTLVGDLVRPLARRVKWRGRLVRALNWSERDLAVIAAVMRGEHSINGFRNRDLQQHLFPRPTRSRKERRQRSARITRVLRVLRAHHLIQKVSRSHRYRVTARGLVAMTAILTTQRVTLERLRVAAA